MHECKSKKQQQDIFYQFKELNISFAMDLNGFEKLYI